MKFNIKYTLALLLLICLVAFVGEANARQDAETAWKLVEWNGETIGVLEHDGAIVMELNCVKDYKNPTWTVYPNIRLKFGFNDLYLNGNKGAIFGANAFTGKMINPNEVDALIKLVQQGDVKMKIHRGHKDYYEIFNMPQKNFEKYILPTIKECYEWKSYTQY